MALTEDDVFHAPTLSFQSGTDHVPLCPTMFHYVPHCVPRSQFPLNSLFLPALISSWSMSGDTTRLNPNIYHPLRPNRQNGPKLGFGRRNGSSWLVSCRGELKGKIAWNHWRSFNRKCILTSSDVPFLSFRGIIWTEFFEPAVQIGSQ